MAQAPALPRGFELPLEPRLPRIGSVDAVALEERAATLAKRSIKKESKLQAFELAVRMMDLTTLEGADTAGQDFPEPPGLFTIDDLGGWDEVLVKFFDEENGVVTEIERNLGVSTEK